MTRDTENYVVEPPKSSHYLIRFYNGLFRTLEAPGDWFRKSVLEPNQQHYPYYHQKFRRVPTIDQCYDDDAVCKFEADLQFVRDKRVDSQILSILRQRFEDCVIYERPDEAVKCKKLYEEMKKGEENWFIKYGDIGVMFKAEECYLKQKHRMIWERRHGPVGTGMKQE